jgi:hypothetical protein
MTAVLSFSIESAFHSAGTGPDASPALLSIGWTERSRGSNRQCAIRTGAVIVDKMSCVIPPRITSRTHECP